MKSNSLPQSDFQLKQKILMKTKMFWRNLHSSKANKKENTSVSGKKRKETSGMVTTGHALAWDFPSARTAPYLRWGKKWDLFSMLTNIKGLLGQLVRTSEKPNTSELQFLVHLFATNPQT